MANRITDVVTDLLQPVIEGLGYEFVGLEYLPQGGRSVLRIYIDHLDGITVDDCERVSHQVSGILEVEDPIRGQYVLEVSSPGADRPLFTREHYERFLGERAVVRISVPLAGRRNFTGILLSLEGNELTMDVDGKPVIINFDQIEKARLAPLFS
jgi:ribosome maturation factor RimP